MKYSADRDEATLLRRALLANAVFSGISGLLIVIFDQGIVSLLTSVEHHLWPLGLMLLGFSALLVWLATRASVDSGWINLVIAADLGWVLGTVVLLAGWREFLSSAGLWIIVGVGLVVLALAELQWFGLRRLKKTVI